MKMPRSHYENENVQFVQELAEVDGPFESPININFRDLTKLELPSLVWNKSESCPKKMKITNTGHTVIISGKWKSERPYLTGGPLVGKYVFSQIHFHWGQDDFKGSEHQVSGESFPLEMHVAHFKTEYLTQENALREKDGMVVVVYLFKLQNEPNASLKKILNLLPHVKQASTSHSMDPKPIISLCNTFKDDYFMYWGSVVTSTCAHILLWIICREPFGISREQVNEFRKILDVSQQPIFQNSRQPQPLHKRNVFLVNASKSLNEPMLPVKNLRGCTCSKSDENSDSKNGCSCLLYTGNQEEIEGSSDCRTGYKVRGVHSARWKSAVPGDVYVYHSIVQRPTIQSTLFLPKRFESVDIGHLFSLNSKPEENLEKNLKDKYYSKSCCFFSMQDAKKMKAKRDKRKTRTERKPFNYIRALSNIMESLETLKNQTFKKLREIESINQEIKRVKSVCKDTEDRKWLHRIEKLMTRQKRFTIRTSEGYFNDLKNLAKECNFDKFFYYKPQKPHHKRKSMERALSCSDVHLNENLIFKKKEPKSLLINQTVKFSSKAQKLVHSFFEDIKGTEELQETVRKDLEIKRIKSLSKNMPMKANQKTFNSVYKGYITQKMFTLGNLGDRFFREITTDNAEKEKNEWESNEKASKLVAFPEESHFNKNIGGTTDAMMNTDLRENTTEAKINHVNEVIPLHRVSVPVGFPESTDIIQNDSHNVLKSKDDITDKNEYPQSIESTSWNEYPSTPSAVKKTIKRKVEKNFKETPYPKQTAQNEKFTNDPPPENLFQNKYSSSNLSTDSTETERMVVAKLQNKKEFRKGDRKRKPSMIVKLSSKELYSSRYKKYKPPNVNLEGYYITKNFKNKNSKMKNHKDNKRGLCDWSPITTQSIAIKENRKPEWKCLTKAKFKVEIERSSDSVMDSDVEYILISPKKKKSKLECQKRKALNKNKISPDSSQTSCSSSDTECDTNDKKKYTDSERKKCTIIKSRKYNVAQESPKITLKHEINDIREKDEILSKIHLTGDNKNQDKISRTDSIINSKKDDSYESILSYPKKLENKTTGKSNFSLKTECIKEEQPQQKSFSDLAAKSTAYFYKLKPSVFTESLNKRDETLIKLCEFGEKLRTPSHSKENIKVLIIKNLEGENIDEILQKPIEGADIKTTETRKTNSEAQTKNHEDREVGLFTTTSSKVYNEEPHEEIQIQEDNKTLSKSLQATNNHRLNAEIQEIKPNHNAEELSQKNDSQIIVAHIVPNMKGDANIPCKDNELQTSVSLSSIKKNPRIRPYSVESLNTFKTFSKKKSKKRPHCSKRNSGHYLRKFSLAPKKVNKVESKCANFLNLSEEEQLKIISLNVAKYLKEKLMEQENNLELELNLPLSQFEQIIFNGTNIPAPEKDVNMPVTKEESEMEYIKSKHDKKLENELENLKSVKRKTINESKPKNSIERVRNTRQIKNAEQKSKSQSIPKIHKTETDKTPKTEKTKDEKFEESCPLKVKKLPLSKPKNNFIKRNKLLAGQYKRNTPPEKSTADNNPIKKNTSNSLAKSSTKIVNKKKEKSNLHQREGNQTTSVGKTVAAKKLTEKIKSASSSTNEMKNTLIPKPTDPDKTNSQQENIQNDKDENSPNSTLALQKIVPPQKSCLPAYKLASFAPTSFEIIENQKREISRYLFNLKDSNVCIPEMLRDATTQKKLEESIGNALINKDLEYLIKLQMGMNNDISNNIEKSMNYIKSLLSQDCNGTDVAEKPFINETLDLYGPFNKEVVLIEMNKFFDRSIPSSIYMKNIEKQIPHMDTTVGSTSNNANDGETTKEFGHGGDSGKVANSNVNELDDHVDYNSDSTYNCEISITLNNSKSGTEGGTPVCIPTCSEEVFNKYAYDSTKESKSHSTTKLDASSSTHSITKSLRKKKRKENEISGEMKQKLLEILEGEIRRETQSISSDVTDSRGILSQNWDESKLKINFQSADSNNDNLEVVDEISERVRQYLSNFKPNSRPVNTNETSKDEDHKNAFQLDKSNGIS